MANYSFFCDWWHYIWGLSHGDSCFLIFFISQSSPRSSLFLLLGVSFLCIGKHETKKSSHIGTPIGFTFLAFLHAVVVVLCWTTQLNCSIRFWVASKTLRLNTITTLSADAIGLDKMDDEKDFKFRSQIKRRNECWQHFLPFSTLIWQAAESLLCLDGVFVSFPGRTQHYVLTSINFFCVTSKLAFGYVPQI